jgi:hypothetical protein
MANRQRDSLGSTTALPGNTPPTQGQRKNQQEGGTLNNIENDFSNIEKRSVLLQLDFSISHFGKNFLALALGGLALGTVGG